MVSRPVDLASAKLRFPMPSATHPRACAAWIRVVMASLTRASRVGPGGPATTSGTVSGAPTGFPDGAPLTVPLVVAGLPGPTRDARVRDAITTLIHAAHARGCVALAIENLNFADARSTGLETMGRGRRGKEVPLHRGRPADRAVPGPAGRPRWS